MRLSHLTPPQIIRVKWFWMSVSCKEYNSYFGYLKLHEINIFSTRSFITSRLSFVLMCKSHKKFLTVWSEFVFFLVVFLVVSNVKYFFAQKNFRFGFFENIFKLTLIKSKRGIYNSHAQVAPADKYVNFHKIAKVFKIVVIGMFSNFFFSLQFRLLFHDRLLFWPRIDIFLSFLCFQLLQFEVTTRARRNNIGKRYLRRTYWETGFFLFWGTIH